MKKILYSILLLFCVVIAFLYQLVKYAIVIPIILLCGLCLGIAYKTVEIATDPTFVHGAAIITCFLASSMATAIALVVPGYACMVMWLATFIVWITSYKTPAKVQKAINKTLRIHVVGLPFYMWTASMYSQREFLLVVGFITCIGVFSVVMSKVNKIAHRFAISIIPAR